MFPLWRTSIILFILISCYSHAALSESHFSPEGRTILHTTTGTASSAFTFQNSSSIFSSLTLVLSPKASLFVVSSSSALRLARTALLLDSQNYVIPFTSSGTVALSDLRILASSFCVNQPLLAVVNKQTPSGSISLDRTVLTNAVLDLNDGTFVSRGHIQSQQVQNCVFDNITCLRNAMTPQTTADDCLLKNTLIKNGNQGIYGEIVTGLTQNTRKEFLCTNTTFTHFTHSDLHATQANKEYKDTEYTTSLNLDTRESYVFQHCTFSLSNSARGITFDYGDHTQTVELSDCTFDKCNHGNYGGGAYLYRLSSVTLASSTFLNCTAQGEYGGSLYLREIRSSLTVRDNLIDSSTSCGGSGIFIRSIASDPTDVVFASNIFNNCSSTWGSGSYGGALFIDEDSYFTIRSCLFSKCKSNFDAGAIYIKHPASIQRETDLWFYACAFSENTAQRYGHDIYIISNYSVSGTYFDPYCYTTTDQDNRIIHSFYDPSLSTYTNTTLDSRVPYRFYRYVSTTPGDADAQCSAASTTNCNTINQAKALGLTGAPTGTQLLYIMLCKGNHTTETNTVEVGAGSLAVTGEGTSASLFTLTASLADTSSLFTLTTGHLYLQRFSISVARAFKSAASLVKISSTGSVDLSDVSISASSASVVMESPLLSIGSGKIICSKMAVSTIVLKEHPLISIDLSDAESLRLAECSFTDITRQTGNGAVLSLTMSTGTVAITSISCIRCSASAGSGGAIYANLGAAGLLSITAGESAPRNTFTSCTAPQGTGGALFVKSTYASGTSPGVILQVRNADFTTCSCNGEYGAAVMIECANTAAVLNPGYWTGTIKSYDPALSSAFWAYGNKGTADETSRPLFMYIFPQTDTTVYVAAKDVGKDTWTCGRVSDPCTTLAQAFANQASTQVFVLQEGTHKEDVSGISLTGAHEYKIAPEEIVEEEEEEEDNTGDDYPYWSNAAEETKSRIVSVTKGVSTLTTGTALVTMGGGIQSLTVSHLSLVFTTASTSSLFDVQAGSLSLQYVKAAPSSASGSVTTPASLITLSTTAALSLTASSFSRVTLSAGSGAIISGSVGAGKSVSITAASTTESFSSLFDTCTATEGNGGAISLTLAATSTFQILTSDTSTTSFTGCSAQTGGAIYLDVTGQPTQLSLASISFYDSGNTATKGASFGQTLFIASASKDYLTSDGFIMFCSAYNSVNNEAYASINGESAVTLASLFGKEAEFDTPSSDGELTFHISATGTDTTFCYSASTPCKTIGFALSTPNAQLSKKPLLQLTTGTHESETTYIVIGQKTVTVAGTGAEQTSTTTLSITSSFSIPLAPTSSDYYEDDRALEDSGVFHITTGTLNTQYFTISIQQSLVINIPLVRISSTGTLSMLGMAIMGSSSLTITPYLFLIGSGTLSMKDTTIQAKMRYNAIVSVNTATSSVTAGDISFSNTTITANCRDRYTFYSSSLNHSLTLSGLTFNQCSGTIIYIYSTSDYSGSLTLKGLQFVSCTGSAISFSQDTASLTIEDCVFTACTPSSSIVDVSASNYQTLTQRENENTAFLAKNCKFTQCEPSYSAISVSGRECTVTDSSFDSCTCRWSLRVESCILTTVSKTTFESCKCSSYGALYLYRSTPPAGTSIVSDCNFTSCSSDEYGGALYIYTASVQSIRNCSFTSCSSSRGGAVYWYYEGSSLDSSSPWFYSCTFSNNSGDRGKDIYIATYYSLTTINDVVDSSCKSDTSGSNLISLNDNPKDDWIRDDDDSGSSITTVIVVVIVILVVLVVIIIICCCCCCCCARKQKEQRSRWAYEARPARTQSTVRQQPVRTQSTVRQQPVRAQSTVRRQPQQTIMCKVYNCDTGELKSLPLEEAAKTFITAKDIVLDTDSESLFMRRISKQRDPPAPIPQTEVKTNEHREHKLELLQAHLKTARAELRATNLEMAVNMVVESPDLISSIEEQSKVLKDIDRIRYQIVTMPEPLGVSSTPVAYEAPPSSLSWKDGDDTDL